MPSATPDYPGEGYYDYQKNSTPVQCLAARSLRTGDLEGLKQAEQLAIEEGHDDMWIYKTGSVWPSRNERPYEYCVFNFHLDIVTYLMKEKGQTPFGVGELIYNYGMHAHPDPKIHENVYSETDYDKNKALPMIKLLLDHGDDVYEANNILSIVDTGVFGSYPSPDELVKRDQIESIELKSLILSYM